MPESTLKKGYHVLTAPDVAAKMVVVTPSVQPVVGTCAVESAHGIRGRKADCCAAVVDATLECKLPRWAQVGDVLHWTSYEQ